MLKFCKHSDERSEPAGGDSRHSLGGRKERNEIAFVVCVFGWTGSQKIKIRLPVDVEAHVEARTFEEKRSTDDRSQIFLPTRV